MSTRPLSLGGPARGVCPPVQGTSSLAGEAVPASLDEVYRAHAPAVSRWAQRLAGPGMDLEDIVHDVFVVVQRRLPDFRGDARLTTWLYEITVRVVQARRRAAWWRRRLVPWGRSAEGRDPVLGVSSRLVDPGPSPADRAERRQANEALYRALESLPEKHRTALILFELEGLSGQEIAAITGTSVANVWVRVSRARAQLVSSLAEWRVEGSRNE